MQTKIIYILLFSSFFFANTACDDTIDDIIPDVPVNIEFNLKEPQFINLNVVMGAVKIDGYGYRNNGVVVFRHSDNEILAFDATCPKHIDINVSVNLDANGSGTATCPHCGTVYYLVNYGYPKNGYPLKRYQVLRNGDYVRIYN
jgi:nitrite reductase/ring-hydroxylating ferredoxin subunit